MLFRWQCTPLEDAKKFDHSEVEDILKKHMSCHPDTELAHHSD